MKAHIYQLTNTANGKFYIGSTLYPDKRRNHHFAMLRARKHMNESLQKDFAVYGESAFRFDVITTCESVERDETEARFIKALRATEIGYNKAIASRVRFGFTVTPEHRSKMSSAQKGHPVSEEARAKIVLARKNQTFSPEYRARMSSTKKGHPTSEETRKKIGASNRGKSPTAEARARMSAAQKARFARRVAL